MKKNYIPRLFLSILPLFFITVPHLNPSVSTNQMNNPEIYMCEAVSSVAIKPTPEVTLPPEPANKSNTYTKTIVLAPENLDTLFHLYAEQYNISSETLKIIAKCESRFNPEALSKNGMYGGLFQYSASTWAATRRAMGLDENPELRFNAEEAIKTTAFKIANRGINAWPHCGKKI